MPHLFKGQSPRQYRPSATRRASGLSPINEGSPTARRRWNMLRQSVVLQSQEMRNARNRNRKLLKLAENLNKAREKINTHHEKQLARLKAQAKALNALADPNYLNAVKLSHKLRKKSIAKLRDARNKVVNELVRNSTSSQIRRNLYAKGIERGRDGTSENNWQTWTNKLWHLTERQQKTSQFFKPTSRA